MSELPPDPHEDHPLVAMVPRGQALARELVKYESHRDVLREIEAMDADDLRALAVGYIYDLVFTGEPHLRDADEQAKAERLFRWLMRGGDVDS